MHSNQNQHQHQNTSSTKKEVNLFTLIVKSESSGLNIEGNNDISGLFGPDCPIKSNKDEPELLLYIKFANQVNLTKITVESKTNEENTPEILKLFANSNNMDFSDAVSNPATQAVRLEGKFGTKISLNVPKFRKLNDLIMYFTREDAEFIQINSLQFYGTVGERMMNFTELKKMKMEEE